MPRGQTAKNQLPEFIEVSEDGERIRCKICLAASEQNSNKWIKKGSLLPHIASDVHASSVDIQSMKEVAYKSSEQTMREETAMEESMDFIILSSMTQSARTPVTGPIPQMNTEEQEMWDNYDTSSDVNFNAGIDSIPTAVEERRHLVLEADNLDIWHGTDFLLEEDPNNGQQLLDSLEQEDILIELLKNANINAPNISDLLDEEAGRTGQSKIPDGWFPYESKTMFLLDTINNLPRTCISNSLMNVFLWVLSEVGARDVPSLYHLRQVQASLQKSSGVPTTQHKSPKGNVFSVNDLHTLVAMDWANPTVCDQIHQYPVIPSNGVISEVYHAQKWRENVNPQTLSPMYDAGNCHYYINKLSQLKDGKFIIPVQWLEDEDGNIFANSYAVTIDHESIANVVGNDIILIKATDLQNNFLDLVDLQLLPIWNNEAIAQGYPVHMPNPDWALAEGNPLYTVAQKTVPMFGTFELNHL